MNHEPAERGRNRLLSRLQPQDYARLLPQLRSVIYESGQLLYEAHAPVDFVYFPNDCVLSAVAVLNDGTGIEVGTIGNEGAAGLTAFIGPSVSPTRMLVQIPGGGMRMAAEFLEQEARANRTLHDLLLRHHHAFLAQMTQSVACNGVHPLLKRCCRWLLMTHDRVGKDELPLTHEFLAFMLAVRRPGVTETLNKLEDQGLITNSRGMIQIVDRTGLEAASCECYRVVQEEYERLLGSA
ncbi:MAG TPA: Crp/Fnr family transcriptional regulator [Pirellulales bacterium]|jgi:CRP-like cAMP-binding protein|nr:Crp/Fnr family transcriptional regulator [Pirellulales bacterium]